MQIPSGFEVNRVVFMCMCVSIFASLQSSEPTEIRACEKEYIHQGGFTPSFYLLMHYFRLV